MIVDDLERLKRCDDFRYLDPPPSSSTRVPQSHSPEHDIYYIRSPQGIHHQHTSGHAYPDLSEHATFAAFPTALLTRMSLLVLNAREATDLETLLRETGKSTYGDDKHPWRQSSALKRRRSIRSEIVVTTPNQGPPLSRRTTERQSPLLSRHLGTRNEVAVAESLLRYLQSMITMMRSCNTAMQEAKSALEDCMLSTERDDEQIPDKLSASLLACGMPVGGSQEGLWPLMQRRLRHIRQAEMLNDSHLTIAKAVEQCLEDYLKACECTQIWKSIDGRNSHRRRSFSAQLIEDQAYEEGLQKQWNPRAREVWRRRDLLAVFDPIDVTDESELRKGS